MAQTTARFDYDFDKVHKQWLGKDWNGWGWWYDYKKIISDNFSNLREVFSTSGFPAHEYIYWYCYDYGNECKPGTVAYSWSSMYILWRNHYTVFCPIFESIQTLEDSIRNAADSSHKQRIMENFEINRGQIMLHEVYHYTVVSNPRTGDYAYKAQPCWDLATNSGTWYAFENADSYALDALAIYVQQHFSQSEPPIPREYYASTAAAQGIDLPVNPADAGAIRQKVFADVPPSWLGAQVVELNPDPTFWTEVVDGSIVPLDSALHVAAEIFGSQGPPAGPVSNMKVTTVSPPPTPATKGPQPTSIDLLKPAPLLSCTAVGVPFPQPPVEGFINKLCGSKDLYDKVIIPPISFGTGVTSDGRGKTLGVTSKSDLPNTSEKLYLGVMFDNSNTGCIGSSQFGRGKDDGEKFNHCRERFRTALNGCQTNTIDAKLGGMVKDVCIKYIITARKDIDPDPFDSEEWWRGQGDFKCKETDVSAISGDMSLLKDRCTCWLDNYENTTDVFKMPISGNCKDVNAAELFTN